MFFFELPFRRIYCWVVGHKKEENPCGDKIYVTCSRCWKSFPDERKQIKTSEPIWMKHHW